ncbi:hypothetical protein J11TS1_15620 [Oceanobacillus sp. J11TS1]|nr:hypothetical protein J11TS1_15620 [Oceanobacillus sp. J11TS1]
MRKKMTQRNRQVDKKNAGGSFLCTFGKYKILARRHFDVAKIFKYQV